MTRVDFVHFKAPGRRVPAWQVALEGYQHGKNVLIQVGPTRWDLKMVDRLTPIWVER